MKGLVALMRFSGQRLKQQREATGIRRERLAADIDRSLQSILQYEKGNITPPEHVVNAIADTLGCSPFAFYDAEPGELERVTAS
jgi:transcriptional regulator with XRE-family HTH domain